MSSVLQMMENPKSGTDSNFNDSLIREVKRNPIVYDSSHPLYGNALKKQETWADIAATLGEKVEAVKTRWRTLRDRYTKERRRVTNVGGGSSFSYFFDLAFLDSCTNDNRCQTGWVDFLMNSRKEFFLEHPLLNSSPNSFRRLVIDPGPYGSQSTQDIPRVDGEEITQLDDNEAATSNSVSPSQRNNTIVSVLNDHLIDEVPRKRIKLQETQRVMSPESLADALSKGVDALQRLADRRPTSQRSLAVPRDADECFADFICMTLKSFDNESRVHARIAILHALAPYQT